jgi:hypothetical protein
MDRIEQAKRSILRAHRSGVPIPTIAARNMMPFAMVRDAIARWCPPSSPEPVPLGPAPELPAMLSIRCPIPAKEPESRKAQPDPSSPIGGADRKRSVPLPERNAKIIEMRRAGMRPADIWRMPICAGMSRNAVIGILQRAGLCEAGTRSGPAAAERIKYQSPIRKKPKAAHVAVEAAPAQPKSRRGEWAGFLVASRDQKKGELPVIYMILEPMSDHAGTRFEDTKGCVWPFDDRSPWPKREHMNADYLRCDKPRESHRNARGELVTLPYCREHWVRAHGNGRPGRRPRPR